MRRRRRESVARRMGMSLDGETVSPLGAPTRYDGATSGFTHTVTEAVDALTTAHFWLISSLRHRKGEYRQ